MAKKNSTALKVDFTGVESSKFIKKPGEYKLEVTEAIEEKSSSKNKMITVKFKVTEGKSKGSVISAWFPLVKQSLWKLRDFLTCVGLEVPDDEMELELEELNGLACGAEVDMEEYDGSDRAKIKNFIGEDDVEASNDDSKDADEEDDADTKKSSKKSKKTSKKDEEEEDDVEDVSSMDEDELEEFVKERGLDIELEDFGSIKKKRAAVEDALEGDASDEEDEKPVKGKKSKKDEEEEDDEKFSEETIEEMDLSDLESLNDDHKLKIKDFEDLSKKEARKAVLKALKKAGLLED